MVESLKNIINNEDSMYIKYISKMILQGKNQMQSIIYSYSTVIKGQKNAQS